MENIDIAGRIAEGEREGLRYKILTLGQLRKWKAWRDPGKTSGQAWNSGEWMIAFEDGSVHFRDGGGELRGPLGHAKEIAEWMDFLDAHRFNRWREFEGADARVH